MKKIVSLILVVLLITLSLVSVSANSPIQPEVYIMNYFVKYYNSVDEESPYYSCKYIDTRYLDRWIEYCLIDFSSKTPIDQPYFNRFGNDNEYYEYSKVTNLLFGSGLTVFAGSVHYEPENRPDNHNEDFYSLPEIASTNPEIIDMIIEKRLTERVGYIGDVDGDGEVAILDATAIQRHLARLDTLGIVLASDIDDNGSIEIIDATMIQRHLVGLE